MRTLQIRLSIVIALVAASMCWTAAASAKPSRTAAKIDKDDAGYIYKFHDDPMQGTAGGAHTPRIRVYPRGMRRTLIRPRLSFVREMLRSVENI